MLLETTLNVDTKKTGDVLVLGLPFEFIVASENRSDRFRNKTDWNQTLREVWAQCGTNEARNITLNCAMLKNTPSNTDRKLKTCSFQHCLRWAKSVAHRSLSNDVGETLTSKHHVGDWNTLYVFRQMTLEEGSQCNDIVFQPVWWKPSGEDGRKPKEQICGLVNGLCEEMFREEFFDTFFRLLQNTSV